MEPSRSGDQRRGRAEWTKIVAAWQRSGLTASAFAASRGLSARTLVWWRWRLSQPQAPAPTDSPRLVEVRVEPDTAPSPQPAWELALAGGATLRVHREISPASLRALLAALGPARRAR